MIKIIGTAKNSVARKYKIPIGQLLRFDDEPVRDMLDVAYFESMPIFSITVLSKKGEETIKIEKEADEPIGLFFDEDSYLISRHCKNKCIFCFVDQLPKGLRETLYVKDDDWRMSFVCGNYVTLTNMTKEDINRIITKKYSPLYVSVHATDSELRRYMLGNKKAEDIMPMLSTLAKNGITINTQIVLCPEINDGKNLLKTLNDLYSLYPAVKSVAIVPVGLTKFRDNLLKLCPFTREEAAETVKMVEEFAIKAQKQNGENFVYCSDEFYIDADLPMPKYEYYGDFDQIENGVGIVAQTQNSFNQALIQTTSAKKKSFTLLCGESAEIYLRQLIEKAKKAFPDLKAEVIAIHNDFFGDTITVSGLVTGGDIIKQLREKPLGDLILIPNTMLREFQDVFLDGVTVKQLQKSLKRKIIKITDGYDLCKTVLNGDYL
ncbi:MAG TPA: DUF512 domain-containing protein [Clostridia bacterium]|nr:DUF512 domain-containing protein [Clostridia bacterium]